MHFSRTCARRAPAVTHSPLRNRKSQWVPWGGSEGGRGLGGVGPKGWRRGLGIYLFVHAWVAVDLVGDGMEEAVAVRLHILNLEALCPVEQLEELLLRQLAPARGIGWTTRLALVLAVGALVLLQPAIFVLLHLWTV